MDYHKERTTFLADYIDWRRPAKKGVVIKCIDEKSKFDRICNAFDMDVDEKEIRGFVINEKDRGQLSVSDAIKALRQNKVLFFEKSGKLRHDFYSSIRYAPAKFGSRRKVYVNLPDDGETIRKYGYTVDDLVDLSFFGKGAFKQMCSERYEQILSKDESSRTFEESRFIKTWKKDGSRNFSRGADGEIDASSGSLFAGMNQEWFSELTTENGNWNAVYFMDKTQIAGMNLNAANILVISQLDSYENGLKLQYLDPLDIEQLIGRISRTGQTEECIVYTCLCNGDKPLTDDDQMFNETYYDILSDPNGFDLFGKSQTEIDFVLPVVMACARHMFSRAGSFVQGKIDEAAYNLSTADFKVIYESEEAQNKASKRLEGVETFPQMLKFAIELEKEGKIIVNRGVADARKRTISVSSAIKILIQIYSRLLSHTDADKSSFYIDDEEA